MSEPIHCDDGCSLSQRELLNMVRSGLKAGPVATAGELAEELGKLPDDGKTPVPTDRGLIAFALLP